MGWNAFILIGNRRGDSIQMKKLIRIIELACTLVLLLSVFAGVVFAQKSIDEGSSNNGYAPTYIGTARITADINLYSSGYAICSSSVSLYTGYDANLTMRLQRKTSYGSWITVTSWSGSGSGSSGVSLSKIYSSLSSGTTYRVYSVAYVYQNGSYIEAVSVASQESTY